MSMTEDFGKQIGNRIKKIREWRRMLPGQLAQKIHASPSYITRIEQGEAVPSVHRLYTIARELNVSIRDLFSAPTFEGYIYRGTGNGNPLYTGKMKDYEYQILINEPDLAPNCAFHPYLMKYKRSPKMSYHRHNGWELIILRSGKLKIVLRKDNIPDEKEEYLKNPFEVILFNSELWHAYIPDGEEAETICVISDTAIMRPETEKNIGIIQFD